MKQKCGFVDNLMFATSKTLSLVINDEPIPKARPRFSHRSGTAYTPSTTLKMEKAVRMIAEQEMEKQKFPKAVGEMPVAIEMVFYQSIPRSKAKWWKQAVRAGFVPCVSRNRGDIDNKVKLYMDAINGLVMDDDSQVCNLHAYCRYSDKPRVEINVTAFYTNIGEIKDKVKFIEGSKDA